jgi:acetyl esterase/lipase
MDAQRAISMARKNAKEWGIDPMRIGVLGFSAGGKTAAMAALVCGKRLYAPQDDVDAAPCNADFGVLVYPAYLVDKNNQLNAEVKATKECPPMFFAHTSDDPVTPQSTLVLAGALQSQKVPVEVHLYPNGGHGYGLRPDKTKQVTSWPERCADWMRNRGIIR